MSGAALPASRTARIFAALNPIKLAITIFDWIRDWIVRFFEAPPRKLGQYYHPRAPLRHKVIKRTIYGLIIFVGIIYGFMVAIFPMFLYLYMAAPIAIMALAIIWALPERDIVPENAMEWLFWAFFISLLIWPNYLAISLPGLPWITAQRLFLAPVALLLLVSVSTSRGFRTKIADALKDSRILSGLFLAFVAIQFVTLFMSENLADTTNRFVSNQLAWTGMFFISCFVFLKEGRALRWARLLSLMVIALAVQSIFEYRYEKILWADHVPSFLAVADESVQRTLAGSARGAYYRLQATFATPLNFAEIMGLATPFLIHSAMRARLIWEKALIGLYIVGHFMVIWGTDARLGMVCFFGSFLLYFFIWSVRRWKSDSLDIFAPAFVFGYPALITGFLALSLVWQRLGSLIWGGGAQQASNDGRKAQWAMLWPKLGRWPFGHGTGQSGEVLGYANAGGVTSVDSYYITVLLDYGIFGFFVFYGMLIAALMLAFSSSMRAKEEEAQLLIPTAVVLGMFIVIKGVLSQEGGHALIFMLLGMIVALTHRIKQAERERQPSAH